ncbi:MAG: tetratricopeptide repeat protein [Thermincola sp.]|nr:tetratricopeptide repeat protein [Thermincola sp.]MDT3704035.1 tetratricopeptide repeat protein [Thermincola sp.]
MSTLAPDVQKLRIPSHEKSFTLLQAIAVILISAVVFVGAGFAAGKVFFWKSLEESRLDQQLAFYKAKVDAQPKVAEDRVNLGYTYYLKGDYKNALQHLKIATEIDPKYADAFHNVGLVYREQQSYDEALEAFSKAAKLAPRDYKNFMQMGVIYNAQGNYKDAITALNRANEEKPGSADVIYQIGVAAEKSGDKDGARELYTTAVNYDPNFKEAKDALARLGGPKGLEN